MLEGSVSELRERQLGEQGGREEDVQRNGDSDG